MRNTDGVKLCRKQYYFIIELLADLSELESVHLENDVDVEKFVDCVVRKLRSTNNNFKSGLFEVKLKEELAKRNSAILS
jgi:hypothetical protein